MNNKSRRRSKRHELDASKQISVNVFRIQDGAFQDQGEPVEAKIVDISANGFKVNSKTAFEFQEKIKVELPRQNGETVITVAEVRWIEPNADDRSWSAGCLIEDAFPQEYIDEMAQAGILDRRSSVRHQTDQPAIGRWELTQTDFPITVTDISANGIGLLLEEEPELGKRIRIRLEDSNSITARAVWQKPVEGGFQVGCEVVEGSPFAIIEASLSHALQGAEEKMGRYQVLSLCGMSLLLVMLIREWFF